MHCHISLSRPRFSVAVLGVLLGTGMAVPARAQMDASGAATGGDTGAAPSASAASAGAAAGGSSAARGAGASAFMAPESIYGLKPVQGPRPVIEFERAMGLAIHNSFDLAIAQERFIQAQLLIRQAWSALLPRLNASVGYTFSWPETKFQGVTQKQLDQQAAGQQSALEGQAQVYDAQAAAAHADGDYNQEYADRSIAARLRQQKDGIKAGTAPDATSINPIHVVSGAISFQMILFNGRAYPGILTAYDVVKQTRATLDRAQTQALYMAAVAYYSAASTRRLIQIAKVQVKNLEEHLAATRVRVEVGALPSLALKRAEVDLVRARATLRTAENGYEAGIGSLASILNLDTVFDVGELPAVPLFEETHDADQLIAQARRTRPDLQAAQINLDIAERGRVDAIMRWMPTVSLTGQGRATTNTSGFSKDPVSYAVSVNANIPLYDGGDRYTAWRQANSKVREAHLLYDQAIQKLELSVRGNIRELELRKINLENQRSALELASAAEKDARARFEVGAATNLEVLDAEQLVAAAGTDLASAELELQLSRLALSFVTGVFDPVLEETGHRVPRGLSPVVLPGGGGSRSDAPDAPPAAPALATPTRAARLPMGSRLPVQPSAMQILGAGLLDGPDLH